MTSVYSATPNIYIYIYIYMKQCEINSNYLLLGCRFTIGPVEQSFNNSLSLFQAFIAQTSISFTKQSDLKCASQTIKIKLKSSRTLINVNFSYSYSFIKSCMHSIKFSRLIFGRMYLHVSLIYKCLMSRNNCIYDKFPLLHLDWGGFSMKVPVCFHNAISSFI